MATSANKRVSGFGTLRSNPRLTAWTSDTRRPLGDMTGGDKMMKRDEIIYVAEDLFSLERSDYEISTGYL